MKIQRNVERGPMRTEGKRILSTGGDTDFGQKILIVSETREMVILMK